MFNRFNDPHPDPVDAWLTATFPLQHQLRAEMAADLQRRAPLPIDAPDKSFLGRVVELAIGLDVCDRAPYARLFNCLGHDYATRMLTVAGYAPGPDATAPGNVSWLRIGPAPHPSRLFSVASRLTHVQCLLRDLRDRRRDAEYAAGMILERHPGLLCRRPDEVFGTGPPSANSGPATPAASMPQCGPMDRRPRSSPCTEAPDMPTSSSARLCSRSRAVGSTGTNTWTL